eukprot:13822968-Alexandrium_andersonii.AAC.1
MRLGLHGEAEARTPAKPRPEHSRGPRIQRGGHAPQDSELRGLGRARSPAFMAREKGPFRAFFARLARKLASGGFPMAPRCFAVGF